MVITREADYAVRLAVCLAAREPGVIASARLLAEEADAPYELARTILGRLADAGILASRRGRSGGFALARPAADIHLKELLSVVGENLTLNICVNDSRDCGRSRDCPVHPVWLAASRVLSDFMAEQTLADLAAKPVAGAPC